MATRRKYKKPQGYYRGGAVKEIDAPIAEDAAPEAEPSPLIASPPVPAKSPLAAALKAQRRAELLQHQSIQQPQQTHQPPPQTIGEYIDALPLSEHKKTFLKRFPEMLQPDRAPIMAFHHGAALQSGIPDDSEAMDTYLLTHTARELKHLGAEPEPEPPVPQRQPPAPPPARAAAPMPQPARRSMPMSAPVSRDVPGASGRRERDGAVSLSPEERDIARRSIMDHPGMPNLTPEQKEYIYWQNKKKLQAMRRDGSYSDQGNG